LSIEVFSEAGISRKEIDTMTIGEKIRDQRKMLGMTQGELAEAAGLTGRTVSKYETGISAPRGSNLKKLCSVLHVSPGYLLNPKIEDPAYGLDEAPYIAAAHGAYGKKAADDLEDLLHGVQAAFAGGRIPQADKDKFFQAVTEAYFATKEEARGKFTPKKYRR